MEVIERIQSLSQQEPSKALNRSTAVTMRSCIREIFNKDKPAKDTPVKVNDNEIFECVELREFTKIIVSNQTFVKKIKIVFKLATEPSNILP